MSTPSDNVFISFPDLSPAEAAAAAKQLAQELMQAGITPDRLQLYRPSQDTQDLGSGLAVVGGAWLLDLLREASRDAAKTFGQRVGAHAADSVINWLTRKWGTRASVTKADGTCVIVGTPSPARLPRTIAEIERLFDLKDAAVIILGASTFPNYPNDRKLDNVAFAQSAQLFRSLVESGGTIFRDVHVLDLFNEDLRADAIVDEIESHLTKHPEVRDVILYYCGHGDFLQNQSRSYYLTLKGTRPGREPQTALVLGQFRFMIEQQPYLSGKRCYVLLDCCFASAAVDAFQAHGLDSAVAGRVEEILPHDGWAFLTASDRSLPAIGGDGRGRTMFTGALVDVLNDRRADGATLSLVELKRRLEVHLKTRHGLRAVIPQIHSPRQSGGDVAWVPLFRVGRNSAPMAPTPEARQTPLLHTKEQVWRVTAQTGHSGKVNDLKLFSENGLVTSSSDGSVKLWNTTTGALCKTFIGHSGAINGLSLAQERGWIVSSALDGLRFWNLNDHKNVATWNVATYPMFKSAVQITPDGSRLMQSSLQGAQLMNVFTGEPDGLLMGCNGWGNRAVAVNWSLMVGAADNEIIVWDAKTTQPVRRIKPPDAGVFTVAISPQADWIAGANQSGRIYLWKVDTGNLEREFVGHKSAADTLAVSSNGELLCSGDRGGVAIIWNRYDGNALREFKVDGGAVAAIEFSGGNKWIYTGGDDGVVRIWRVATATVLKSFLDRSPAIRIAKMSVDGRWIIAGGDRNIWIWNGDTAQLAQTITPESTDRAMLEIAADGEFFVHAAERMEVMLPKFNFRRFINFAIFETCTGRLIRNIEWAPDGPYPSPKCLAITGDCLAILARSSSGDEIRLDIATGSEQDLKQGDSQLLDGGACAYDRVSVGSSTIAYQCRGRGEVVESTIFVDGGWVSIAPDGLSYCGSDGVESALRLVCGLESKELDGDLVTHYRTEHLRRNNI